MSIYIEQIRMINLQSHVDTIIDLPEKGIVRFVGPNSNGKSVFVKALGKVLRARLHIRRERVPLVNREVEKGYLIMTRSDGMILTVCIAKEASQTFVELKIPSEELVLKRHITTDKNTQELIRMFGWHVEEERGISLNLYETFDPLLLVTTSDTINGAIVNSVITDNRAEKAIEAMTVERKGLIAISANIDKEIATQNAVLGSLQFYPEEEYLARAHTLKYLSNNLQYLSTPSIKYLRYIPNVDTILKLDTSTLVKSIKMPDLRVVPSLSAINHLDLSDFELSDISRTLSSNVEILTAYKEGKCSTCGRLLHEGGH